MKNAIIIIILMNKHLVVKAVRLFIVLNALMKSIAINVKIIWFFFPIVYNLFLLDSF